MERKISLAKHMAVLCAEKNLDRPEDPSNYIPIFVRSKYGLTKAYGQRNLKLIAPKGETMNRKILVIYDGLEALLPYFPPSIAPSLSLL